ncbi:MAG TPA: efflux RND transporter permease subunit [Candidatus Baltobacteraceae bacterium]|nr:efflux RND transporter permease subunit [Candidatus Baltobacteraceae bacterium]
MTLADFGIRHAKAIAFLVAILFALGIWAYTTTPASIFPNMSFARIDVVIDAGDLPPDQVRLEIAQPLTRAFLGLPSVTRVLATSAQGNAELLVDFSAGTDSRFDLQYVNQAIADQRSTLPAEANPQAMVVTPTSEVVIAYALTAPGLSQTVLREVAQQSIVPQFYGTTGLARIAVMGGPLREYHVVLDPGALAAHGLSADDVSKAIADANVITSLGLRQQYYQRNVLIVDSSVAGLDKLNSLTISDASRNPVTLASIAKISEGVEPMTSQASYNGRHAVAISFYALPGADAVRMAREVRERMARISASLHNGVTLQRAWDQSDLVVESQRNLRDAILLGALLAVLVILAFLRDFRMTLVAAAVIPIAMAITVFLISRTGETLNLMSVGGLAVAVGLIIDDAIVVIENVARHVHEKREQGSRAAIVMAMTELSGPMIASTLTTVVVFIPLLLLSGIAGFFFRSLAFTLAEALLVSLCLALFVTPILSLAAIRAHAGTHGLGAFAALLRRYESTLRVALAHRRAVYLACAGILVLTFLVLARLPSDFLPELDEGQLQIDYLMPVGTTLTASDAAATHMEQVVMSDPAVLSVVRLTGEDPNGFSPIQVREGKLRIRLKPLSERDPYDVVADRLRERINSAVPAASVEFTQLLEEVLGDLSGSVRPIMITLSGPDQTVLVQQANALAQRLQKITGLTDVLSGVSYDDPTMQVEPFGARLAALGLSQRDFASAMQAQTQGTVAAVVPSQNLLVPVRVQVAGAPDFLSTARGLTPVTGVAALDPPTLTTDVTEINGQRVMTVTAGSDISLSSAIAAVQRVLRQDELPPGYSTSIGGAYRDQQRSFREFGIAVVTAVLLVFFVMLAAFKSFRLPLVILTAIPLAAIGVAVALFVTGTPFNVSSFMGLLLLVGIVVKNGILLIDVANRQRLAGASVADALIAAGRARLRPILMTTFAAIGGLLPLAIGIGAGSAMEKPLAIAVIGGLSTATAFTLVVIPVLYAGIAGKWETARL